MILNLNALSPKHLTTGAQRSIVSTAGDRKEKNRPKKKKRNKTKQNKMRIGKYERIVENKKKVGKRSRELKKEVAR